MQPTLLIKHASIFKKWLIEFHWFYIGKIIVYFQIQIIYTQTRIIYTTLNFIAFVFKSENIRSIDIVSINSLLSINCSDLKIARKKH